MESRYKFNSLGVAIESETPDGGLTIYKPDLKGRPDESINAEQRRRAIEAYTTPGSPDYNKYVRISSRTHYDYLGRIDSVYEQKLVSPQPSYNLALYYPLPGQPNVTTTPSQITVTLYDNGISTPQNGGWIPKNTIARVAGIRFYESKNAPFKHGTYYSYDIHGNVKSMITDVPALSDYNQRYHRTDYYYDLISGKVNEVHYQHKQLDRMYYRYTYDADNRLVTAESSRDYVGWERDAKYFYYAHGPLKRVETGHRKIQGTDYFYTIHGWLKGVNSGALNETYDLGKDGWEQNSQNPNALIARDAFGFTLDYYTGDYKPVATGLEHVPEMAGDFETAVLQNGLFNGNIVRMQTALRKIDETRMDVLGNAYKYDQLNRIRKNNSFISTDLHTGNSWSGVSETGAYRGEYTYDANGNIITLKRNNAAGTLTDDFNNYNYTSKPTPSATAGYNYVGPQNRLDYIHDNVGSLGMENQGAANYGYDEIGNLVKDESEEIAEIKWTVYGKVKSVKRESSSTKPDLDFQYNASGQRYLKVVKPKNANGTLKGVGDWKFTFYQHDAQGNVLAVYDIKDNDDDCGYEMYLAQHVLYGSARLGVNNYGNDVKLGTSRQNFSGYVHANYWICAEELDDPKDEIPPVTPPSTTTNTGMITLSPGGKYEHIIPIDIGKGPWTKPINVNNYAHVGHQPSKDPVVIIPGRKQYEFSNHLGNVLVTVSDMPIGVDGGDALVDYYMPDVLTVSDYEPFGAPLEGRNESEDLSYRFGYNGVEKENDLYGEGNAYSFEYRIHNARIGRFLSVDPLEPSFPWFSPYVFAENMVIRYIELEGLEIADPVLFTHQYRAWKYGHTPEERSNHQLYYQNRFNESAGSMRAIGAAFIGMGAGFGVVLAVETAPAVMCLVIRIGTTPQGQLAAMEGLSFAANMLYYGPDDPFPTPGPGGELGKAIGQGLGKLKVPTLLLGKSYVIGKYADEAENASHMFKPGFGLGIPNNLSPANQITKAMYQVVDGGGKIFMDLTDVSLSAAKTGFKSFDEASSVGKITEWELSKILRDKDLFNNTIFHYMGEEKTATQLGLKLIE